MTPFFGSRYDVIRPLGEGGFGTVYEAFDRDRKGPVALKALSRLDAASLYRFKREFRLFADLDHPNLVKLYELGNEGEQWFFTMELLQGTEWLSHVRPNEGRTRALIGANTEVAATERVTVPALDSTQPMESLAATEVATKVAQSNGVSLEKLRRSIGEIAQALAALHAVGVVHRDLKPSNVIVTEDHRAVLLDFGIATSEKSQTAHITDPNAIIGTPAYMAPEQATGQAVSGASDLYALGVMLFEALTGQLPFAGASLQILYAKMGTAPKRPSQLAPETPADLDDLCVSLLATSASARPTDAAVLSLLGVPERVSLSGLPQARPSSQVSTNSSIGMAAFVGRRDSLDILKNSFDEIEKGAPRLVEISGPSGVGKSALVQEFLSSVGPTVVKLQGRCFQRETVPYNAFDQLVDDLSHYLRTLSSSEAAKLVPRDASVLMRVFPVLGRVPCFAEAPRKSAHVQDPHQLRSKAFGALRELLARMTDRGPVVLSLDDVQWGDADSAWLLAELLSPPEPPPLLVLMLYRSNEKASSEFLRELDQRFLFTNDTVTRAPVMLEGLKDDDARQLALKMLSGRADAEARAEQLLQEAGGSPFLLGELALHLCEGSELTVGRSGVDSLVRERVSRLPEEARLLLALVATADRGVDLLVLSRAADLDEESTRRMVSQLRLAKLVRFSGQKGNMIEPYHDRVREAVADGIEPDEARRQHGRLALALNETGHADAETLYRHFRAAGMVSQAHEAAHAAVENAKKMLAFDRVVQILDDLLSSGQLEPERSKSLRVGRTEALIAAGRCVQAAHALLELSAQAEGAARLDYQRRAGEQFLWAGEMDRGMAELRRVLKDVGIWVPKNVVLMILGWLCLRTMLRVRGWVFKPTSPSMLHPMSQLRLETYIAVSKVFSIVEPLLGAFLSARGAWSSLRHGYARGVTVYMSVLAGHYCNEDPSFWPCSEQMLFKARALAKDLQSTELDSLTSVAWGVSMLVTGKWADSLTHFDLVVGPLQESGASTQWDRNQAMGLSMLCRSRLGRYSEMSANHRRFLVDAGNRGDLYLMMCLKTGEGGFLWLVEDRVEEGIEDIQDMLSRWRTSETGIDLQRLWAEQLLVEFEIYSGNVSAALSRVTTLVRDVAHSALRVSHVVREYVDLLAARCAVAYVASDLTDPSRREALQSAHRQIRQMKLECYRPLVLFVDASVARLQGREEESLRVLRLAIEKCQELGLSGYTAVGQFTLGALLGGDEGKALQRKSEDWLRSEGVINPERFVQAHAPGFAAAPAARPRMLL